MFPLLAPCCVLENMPSIYRYKFRGMQPPVVGIRGISTDAAWSIVIELS